MFHSKSRQSLACHEQARYTLKNGCKITSRDIKFLCLMCRTRKDFLLTVQNPSAVWNALKLGLVEGAINFAHFTVNFDPHNKMKHGL